MARGVRKPSSIKRLEGREYDIKNQNEPEPEVMEVATLIAPEFIPPFIKGDALSLWMSASPVLVEQGVMTEMDTPALGAMCMAYGEMVASYKALQLAGGRKQTTSQGFSRSPESMAFDAAFRQFTSMLKEFGMTPASRPKIESVLDKDDADAEFEATLD